MHERTNSQGSRVEYLQISPMGVKHADVDIFLLKFRNINMITN